MKVRTIGPILMMALGATLMVAPASGWVGALSQVPCDTSATPGAVQPCSPCPTDIALGVVDTCDTTIPLETVVETTPDTAGPDTTDVDSGGGNAGGGLPDTGSGSSTPWMVLIGGTLVLAGGALLVTGRNRRPAEQP